MQTKKRLKLIAIVFLALALVVIGCAGLSFRGGGIDLAVAGVDMYLVDGHITFRSFANQPIAGEVVNIDGWAVLGFSYYRLQHVIGSSTSFVIPLWPLFALFAILCIFTWRKRVVKGVI